MKKIVIIVLVILVLLAAALAAYFMMGKKSATGPAQVSSESETQAPSVGETMKQGLFDILSTGAGMKCTIDDPQSGQLTMFAKGDKAKVEGFAFMGGFADPNSPTPPKEEKGTMVNDGTWAYMWSGKEGMKFNIKEMESLAPKDQNQNNSQSEAMNWKDWVKDMDEQGTKYDCRPAVLSDSDFTPPSDVQFQDWGEMMKGFMKMGEEMKNKLPGGTVPQPGQ